MPLTTTTTVGPTITLTTAGVTPMIWSRLTADAREENLEFLNTFDRSWEPDLKTANHGDRVIINGIDNLTVGTTLGVGGTVSYSAGALRTHVVLIVDTHAYRAFDLEYEAALFANVNLMEKLAGKAGYAVSLKLDNDAAGFIDDFSQTVGTLAVPLTDDDVIDATRLLNDAIAPAGGRFAMVSPLQQSELWKIDRYVNAQYSKAIGSVDTKTFRGQFAGPYNMTWIMTGAVEGSNAAGRDNGIYHREAVAAAVLDEQRITSMMEIDTDSTKFVVHALYGMIEVRDTSGVWAKGA